MAESASAQIQEAIVSGVLTPGQRLVETELCDELGISRHPVREALRLLSRKGLVELRPNRGAVVAHLSPAEVLEVYRIRRALGLLALSHLLEDGAPPPDALTVMRHHVDKVLETADVDQSTMVANDLAFQTEIAVVSGMPRVADYLRELAVDVLRFINATRIQYPHRRHTAEEEVLGLYEAIETGDYPRAEAIWSGKFERASARLIAHIDTSSS